VTGEEHSQGAIHDVYRAALQSAESQGYDVIWPYKDTAIASVGGKLTKHEKRRGESDIPPGKDFNMKTYPDPDNIAGQMEDDNGEQSSF